MDLSDDTRALLVEYREAHVYWKALQDGPEKVAAKRNRNTLHGKVLERIELMGHQTEK